jgi:hypothetical protein
VFGAAGAVDELARGSRHGRDVTVRVAASDVKRARLGVDWCQWAAGPGAGILVSL